MFVNDLLNKRSYKDLKGNNIIECLDLYNRKRINTDYIPQLFNNDIYFISSSSFMQNHKILSKKIRKYVLCKINNLNRLFTINKVLTVGGESYLYILNYNKDNYEMDFITNSESIYKDYLFNINLIHPNKRKNYKGQCINYNNYLTNKDNAIINKDNAIINNDNNYLTNKDNANNANNYDLCIINLSSLNINLLHKINLLINKVIIIISCHHDDFWKRIKILNNFKLMKRQQFVCPILHYFITVNIFYNK